MTVVTGLRTTSQQDAADNPVLLHRSPYAEVWCGDARQVLASKATESVDLVVTDPPFPRQMGCYLQLSCRGDGEAQSAQRCASNMEPSDTALAA